MTRSRSFMLLRKEERVAHAVSHIGPVAAASWTRRIASAKIHWHKGFTYCALARPFSRR